MKKKAIIVTVHNSENCGSFLQAFAMQKILQKIGYDVAFLFRDTKNTSHSKTRCLSSILYFLFHLKFSNAWNIFYQWITFESLHRKYFHQVKINGKFASETDLIVLGSDTIWNFEDKYFYDTAERLLGCLFKGKSIISYAASLGNTSTDIFKEVVSNYGGLNHIKKILVRDSYSQRALKSAFNRDSQLVCDPTLLLPANDFEELCKSFHIEENYILLYYFGDVSTEIKDEIIRYSISHNLRIVSLIYKREWCDFFVPSSPINMISYFRKATAVITNTFHGCAFSLVFQKPFAVHEEGKVKVKELLDTYNSDERLFSDCGSISNILDKKISNRDRLDLIANQSMKILRESIK